MGIRMIVTDLDRTLLRADKTISDYTAEMLAACQQRGIKVVFATARPKNRVEVLSCASIADAIITDNGALVYMGDMIVESFGIPAKAAKSAVEALAEALPGERISIEYPTVKVANFGHSDLWHAEIINDLSNPLEEDATKIVVNAGAEVLDKVSCLLGDELYAQVCEGRLILIMHKSAAKLDAVFAVAERMGISPVEIAAFGDDHNDAEMLRNCGIGVAVENAIPEVKAVADYICDTNDNDGVAKWIEEKVL